VGAAGQDRWARWLLTERFGGSADLQRQTMAWLEPVRDRVLDGAQVQPTDTILDVGCGDGLLGFTGLDRAERVIFSDISLDLLDRCRRVAEATEASDRCEFVQSALPALAGIEDAVADAVVLRSVLIYVSDKATAFDHLYRVLRPGGRLSLFEPINRFGHPEPPDRLWGFDVTGLESLAERVHAAGRSQNEHSTLLDFDERDLLRWAERAGFDDLNLTYEASVGPERTDGLDLDTFLRMSPNPTMPTLGEILDRALAEGDRHRLQQRFAEQLHSGGRRMSFARAYLTGARPS
jgi:ubiquinone/menaquinone biosynthesis C-methylase UbiE